MFKKNLHICHSLELGGITTFVNALVNLNTNSNSQHHILLWQKSAGGEFINDISNKKNKRQAFNKIIKDYNLIFVHSLKPFMILGLLKRNKDVYLFQHGITFGSGLTKYLKQFYYFFIINVLNFEVICSSDFAKNKLLSKVSVFNRGLLHKIPFGIDLKRNNNLSETNDIFKIGFVGRLVKQKRIHKIFEAFQQLNCNSNINFRVAGTGPLLNTLKAKSLSIKNKNIQTVFDGHVADIISFLKKIDILILPSKGESYGLVVLEALSQNIPVIVFEDSGACVDFIKPNINGFIVNNSKELASLLCELNSIEKRMVLKKQVRDLNLSLYDISNTRIKLDQL